MPHDLHPICDYDDYTRVFQHIPFAMSITTLTDGRYVDVNAAWLAATGYERGEVIGKTVRQMDIWRKTAYLSQVIAEVQQTGPKGNIRTYFRTKNGQVRTCVCTADIVSISGQPHLLWVVNYIADPAQLNDKLLQDNRFNRAMLMHSSNLMVVCDPLGLIIRVNEACCDHSGFPAHEIIGRLFWDMITDQDEIRQAKSLFSRSAPNESTRDQLVSHWRTRSGQTRIINWTSTFLYDEDIGTALIINIGTDITAHRTMEDRLRDKEAELRCILENANGIIFTLSEEGNLLFISPGWTELLGHDICDVQGRPYADFVHPDDVPKCSQAIVKIVASGEPFKDLEYRVRHKDGSWCWHRCSGGVARDENGQVLYYIGIAVDITDRKQIDEDLRVSEDKFSKAFNASPTPFSISTLREGRFIDVNDTFCQVVGYSREEIIDQTVFDLDMWVNHADRSFVYERLVDRKPVRNLDIQFRKKSGEVRLGSFSGDSIDVNRQVCLLSILTDVTEQKRADAEIKYLSFHDKLTGLFNRAYFEEEMIRMDTKRQLPISIIMGDVNGLKVLNDTVGHQVGDQLLQIVAAALKESCREEDVVARWGGDEFVMLLPRCSPETALQVMERIKACDLTIKALPVTPSIALGTATKVETDQDMLQIIKEAEDKMYRNKLLENRNNRNSFLVSMENTLWAQNHETKEHCLRMQEMAEQTGRVIGLSETEMENLRLLTALHDIGKIAIPSRILDKPGILTSEEWEIIRRHPEIGYRIALSSPEMAPIAEAILHHHECWDGSGYPLGLKHEEIPLLSRIIALVDAYDVMTNGRPYQSPITPQQAWLEIEKGAGTLFDPHLVQALDKAIL